MSLVPNIPLCPVIPQQARCCSIPALFCPASPPPCPCSSFFFVSPQKAISLPPAVSASRKGGITAKSFSFQIKQVFGVLSGRIHLRYKEAEDCTRTQTMCFPPFME